ncbi:MAG: Ig-like domain-containing protein [Prevotellaceae bacterium]|jgi:uncharacterized protein YjdB|nr:Ig-like domain-containing protein [Prevotellaceae bacterium]
MKQKILSFFAIVAICFGGASFAGAVDYTVTTVADNGDNNNPTAGSLRAAFVALNTVGGTITIDPLLSGETIVLTAHMLKFERSASAITTFNIVGNGITIDGQNQFQILNLEGTASEKFSINIDRVHFKNGGALSYTSSAINIDRAVVVMTSCIFSHCRNVHSSGQGGAINLNYSDFDAFGCTFYDNYSIYRGGAIYTTGATSSDQRQMNLTGNIFYQNSSPTGKNVYKISSSYNTINTNQNVYDGTNGASSNFDFGGNDFNVAEQTISFANFGLVMNSGAKNRLPNPLPAGYPTVDFEGNPIAAGGHAGAIQRELTEVFYTLFLPSATGTKQVVVSGGYSGTNIDIPANTQVSISVADPGFMYWKINGANAGNANPLTITMDANKTVTAVYHHIVNSTGDAIAEDGVTTLREAITSINSDGDGEISFVSELATQTITLTSDLPQVNISGELRINGNGVTISKNDISSTAAGHLYFANGTATISRVHFTKGRCSGDQASSIYVYGPAQVNLHSCIFTNNKGVGGSWWGGVLRVNNASGKISAYGCNFYANAEAGTSGTARAIIGYAASGTLEFIGNIFYDNTSRLSTTPLIYGVSTIISDYNVYQANATMGGGKSFGTHDILVGVSPFENETPTANDFFLAYGSNAAGILPAGLFTDYPNYPTVDYTGDPIVAGGQAGARQDVSMVPVFSFSYSSSSDAGGTVTHTSGIISNGKVSEGETIVLTATPNAGYALLYWLVGTEKSSETSNTLSTTVTGNTTVTAVFGAKATVNSIADNTDADEFTTLREAITAANTAGIGEISFASALEGQTITLSSTLPTVTGDLTIAGKGVTVSGAGACRILDINGISKTVNISGVHFANASVDATGSAINLTAGTLNLQSCIFSGNRSSSTSSYGAAVYCASSTTLNVKGCTFYDNHAAYNRAGAIYFTPTAGISITGNIFYGNTANSAQYNTLFTMSAPGNQGYNVYDDTDPYSGFLIAESGYKNATDTQVVALPIYPATLAPFAGRPAVALLPAELPAGYPTLDFYGQPIVGGGQAGAIQATAAIATGVNITPATAAFSLYQLTQQLSAEVLPSEVSQTVTWSSDNTAVATVNAAGLVTAVAVGTANIIATAVQGGVQGTCVVTITPPVTDVTVTPATFVFGTALGTQPLTAAVLPAEANQVVTWSSDNEAAATVDATGLVTAIAKGVANIIATGEGGTFKDTCVVTVIPDVASITLDKPYVAFGSTLGTSQLTATVLPAEAVQTVTWSGGDPAVATVDATGLVTAVGAGTAVITATANDGKVATSTVTVYSNYDKVFLVTTTEDANVTTEAASPVGSLRRAAYQVNAATGTNLITFAPNVANDTIILVTNLIGLTKSVTVEGDGVTISGGKRYNIFNAGTAGTSLTVRRVHFMDAAATGSGTAVRINNANVTATVESCIFSNNFMTGASSFGGAVWNQGTLNIRGCTFYNNRSFRHGGAIYNVNSGKLTLTGNVFYANKAGSVNAVQYSKPAGCRGEDIFCEDPTTGTGAATVSAYNVFGGTTVGLTFGATDVTSVIPNFSFATFRVPADGAAAGKLPAELPTDYPTVDFYGQPIVGGGQLGAVQAKLDATDYLLDLGALGDGTVSIAPVTVNADGIASAASVTVTPTPVDAYATLTDWEVNDVVEPEVEGQPKATLTVDLATGAKKVRAVIATTITVTSKEDLTAAPTEVLGDAIMTLRGAMTLANGRFRSIIKIADALSGDTIKLTGYTANFTLPKPVRDMVIEGNGITIKASGSTNKHLAINGTITHSINGSEPIALVPNLTFRRIRFIDGNPTNTGSSIQNQYCTLTLESCIFSNNRNTATNANNYGGAVYSNYGLADIKGCTFYNNTTPGTRGGALAFVSGDFKLTGNVFYGNTTTNTNGSHVMHNAYNAISYGIDGGYNVYDNTSYQWTFDNTVQSVSVTDPQIVAGSLYVLTGTSTAGRLPAVLPADYPKYDFYGNEIEPLGQAGAVQVFAIDAEQPSISANPVSAVYDKDATGVTALSVTATSGDGGTLGYQWYVNTSASNEGGEAVLGVTYPTFTPPVDVVGTFYYYVVVSNTNTNVDGHQTVYAPSAVATIVVNPIIDAATPVIGTQPAGASYDHNATATALSVAATISDAGTLSYQWFSNTDNSATGGTSVGTNDASYTPSTATVGTLYYYVVVTNTNNAVNGEKVAIVTSNVVAIVVNPIVDAATPVIGTQPAGTSYNQNAAATALSVAATISDAGTLSYQWFSNTANSATGGTSVGTNDASYTPSTAVVGTLYYYVVVTNTNNSVNGVKVATATSDVVAIVVNPIVDAATPVIGTQPAGAIYVKDAVATALSVTATISDAGTLSYEWFSNTVNSATGGTSVGTEATYTPSTATVGETYYYVVVTNTNNAVNGTKVVTATSATAKVTVNQIVDVNTTLLSEIMLYPNPFVNELSLTGATGCTLTVYSSTGMAVRTQLLTAAEEIIDLSELSAGLYFFLLEKDGETKMLKAVKID